MNDGGASLRRADRVTSHVVGGVFAGLVVVALAYGALRLLRSEVLFQYTEGPVLGSLAALLETGSTGAMYPADAWSHPPLVLTLYPPLFFWLSAALQAVTGAAEAYFAPRLLSLAATGGVLGMLVALSRRRRVPWSWTALLLGGLLINPGVYNLMGAAQVDTLGLLWTAAGILCVLGEEKGDGSPGRWAAAAGFFLLAFFTKQSYVAAPAALGLAWLVGGHRLRAVGFLGALAAAATLGTLLLDRATGGGYLANAFGSLRGSAGFFGVRSTLADSVPAQWIPLLLLVALMVRGGLRPRFPELYAALAWPLHLAAMSKIGASVNYLLEPLFALVLLAIVRARSPGEGELRAFPGPRPLVWALVAWLGAASVALGADRVANLRQLAAQRDYYRIVGLQPGYPLVDAILFPAVLREGTRPYLNDPFAFGVLLEGDRWDESGLAAELRSRRVPLIVTQIDLALGPAPADAEARRLLFAYLWRAPTIWGAIMENYEPINDAPPFIWLPARGSP
ncbi:MAG: hypothetical protein ACE5JR_08400 [Gemmatimonadota bacterium]